MKAIWNYQVSNSIIGGNNRCLSKDSIKIGYQKKVPLKPPIGRSRYLQTIPQRLMALGTLLLPGTILIPNQPQRRLPYIALWKDLKVID